MSYDLTGQKVSFTYGRVVQVVSGSYYDGYGNLLPIGTASISASISGFATTGSNIFIGDQTITGSVFVTNIITGSLNGTASYAGNSTTSSYSNTSTSASYALTASYAGFAETTNNAQNSQNAQDILVYVKNTSGAIITKGHLVRIVGVDNSSNNPTIALADYSSEQSSANTIGYTNEDFAINAFGYVITEGRLVGVNTSNFTSGDLLYLSSSGDFTNVKPIPPNHGVRVGQVIRSQSNNGSIYVTIDNGAELDELHNVIDTSTTASYGDLLIRSGSVWTNSRNLSGSYILSGSLSTNDGFNSISITASNISSSQITGSVYGTSSWSTNSLSASYYSGNVTSASYSLSASFAPTNTNITASSLTVANNYSITNLSASRITTNNIVTFNSSGSTSLSTNGTLTLSGNNTRGGSTIHDFLYVTNTYSSVLNGTKVFRLNGSGDLEIINDSYTNRILILTDSGSLQVPIARSENVTQLSNTGAGLKIGNYGSIFDDGNFHIHSIAPNSNFWVNASGSGMVVINGQTGATGGVCIGTSTQKGYVTINGSVSAAITQPYGYLISSGAGSTTGTSPNGYSLTCNDRIMAIEFDAPSDERLKNIQGEIPLNKAIDFVNKVTPIHFKWKDNTDTGLKSGFSAQQTYKSGFEHLINVAPHQGLPQTIDDEGFASPQDAQFVMNYEQVIPYHSKLIKHLLEKIEQLENKIISLENKLL